MPSPTIVSASIYFNRKDYSNATAYIAKVIKLYPFDYTR